jgi:hypothetical protein
MDVGWQGVPRLSRPPTLWTAPGQPAKALVRPPSRPGSRRKKARPASAPAGRRRRRAKVQLLEPLPTVPQDAEVSKDGFVAVQLPPLAESSESFPPTPQLSARPATAGGPSSLASDSLLSWQPSLFLPSVDASLDSSLASEESANYWAKRRRSGDKTEGELCAAIARRDHDAVEEAEMSLGEGDRVLVLREEMSREPGWVFATCGDDAGYVPRNYLVPEEAPLPYESESTATAISASAFYRM